MTALFIGTLATKTFALIQAINTNLHKADTNQTTQSDIKLPMPSSACPKDSEITDIKELAKLLGLSIGTVSRSLNNRKGVSTKTRQRVLAAAKANNYHPNSAARQLKARPSLIVGVFFAPYYGYNREINPNALNLIERLRRSLKTKNMALKVLYYESDEELKNQIMEVDVGFFYGHFESSSFSIAHNSGTPSIVYGKQSKFDSQISLLTNSRQSCNTAVQYLAALGHTHIGMVTGPSSELYYRAYAESFPATLIEFNLPIRQDWVFQLSDENCNQVGCYDELLPLLRSHDRPTALVIASDWLAIGARKAARDAGLSIPKDISIIGHDNIPLAAELEPPLTTFDIHANRIAQTIVHLVTQLGQNRESPKNISPERTILLHPDFIKRASCRSLRPPIGNITTDA